jgi:hypothetical protein
MINQREFNRAANSIVCGLIGFAAGGIILAFHSDYAWTAMGVGVWWTANSAWTMFK